MIKMKIIRVIRRIPKFIASDLTEYGGFEPNEVVKMPDREADLLIKKQFATLIGEVKNEDTDN